MAMGLTITMAIDIVFLSFVNATASVLARSAFNLEIDMIKPPTILTRRSVFRAGTGLAVAGNGNAVAHRRPRRRRKASRQAGAEPLNGDGFYRFKIGDFQATVISDGYGQIPISTDPCYERL